MGRNIGIMQDEELSCALDRLNDGNCPAIADKEIEELIEMAAIVKQTHQQEGVPRLFIDQIVNKLAVELGEKKQKRRTQWFYGGLASVAATLLIAIGIQFLAPQSLDKNIAQEMDSNSQMEKVVAVIDEASIPAPQSASPMSKEPEKKINSEKALMAESAQATTIKPTDSIANVLVEMIQVPQATPGDEQKNQVAMLEKEVLPEKVVGTDQIRARMSMNFSAKMENDNQIKGESVTLLLPNQVPQSITVDHNSGTIRQVYDAGMDEQIIITQRAIVKDNGIRAMKIVSQDDNKESIKSLAPPDAYKNNKNNYNLLTVKIDKYSVTIEGNKTTAELQKIVDSLVVKKMEKE